MTDHDWSILEIPEVVEIVDKAVAEVVGRVGTVIHQADDLQQEAYLRLTDPRMAARVREQVEEGRLNFVYHELRSDLMDVAKGEVRRQALQYSRERLIEDEFKRGSL